MPQVEDVSLDVAGADEGVEVDSLDVGVVDVDVADVEVVEEEPPRLSVL